MIRTSPQGRTPSQTSMQLPREQAGGEKVSPWKWAQGLTVVVSLMAAGSVRLVAGLLPTGFSPSGPIDRIRSNIVDAIDTCETEQAGWIDRSIESLVSGDKASPFPEEATSFSIEIFICLR